MVGDNMYTKSASEKQEFLAAKDLVIKSLKEGNYTFKTLSEMTGMKQCNIASMVQNLRQVYNIESAKAPKSEGCMKYYHITRKLEQQEKEKTLYAVVPIWDLPKVIYKSDLLSWHLQNQIYKVESSRQLVEIAKENGIKVYERNFRGEAYYL